MKSKYQEKKEGVEDCVDTIQGLVEYTKKSKERLITADTNCNINRKNLRTNNKTKSRKQKWEEKQMHGYFK